MNCILSLSRNSLFCKVTGTDNWPNDRAARTLSCALGEKNGLLDLLLYNFWKIPWEDLIVSGILNNIHPIGLGNTVEATLQEVDVNNENVILDPKYSENCESCFSKAVLFMNLESFVKVIGQ